MNSAKSAWADARVLAMKRGSTPNVELVENSLGRKAIDTKTDRTILASGPNDDKARKQVGSGEGTDDDRKAVAAAETAERKPAVEAPKETPIESKTVAAVEEKPIQEKRVTGGESQPIARQTKPVEEKAESKPVVKEKPAPVVEEKPVVAAKEKPAVKEKPIAKEEEEEEEAPKPVLAKRSAPRDQPSGEEAKSMRTLDTESKPPKRNGKKGAESINFGLASTRLSSNARTQLDRHVAFLRSHENATILIEGHTDDIGSEEINLVLAEERAERARKYLLRKGIAESRITTQAFGETNPPYSPSSNPKNRCAFFKIQGE
jgi:outer membrane protein OmpA-like peptidoglycan-associated protein